MKILWIEDFGAGLAGAMVAIDMFGELIPAEVFNREYNPDEELSTELPRLFQKHSLHEMYVCKSYVEWKKSFKKYKGDFDIIIIDINLERYKTPQNERPDGIDHPDFDKRAGFHIYYQLIKNGFPDDNIAFFTGEENTLNEFTDYCREILIDKPQHTFEKKPDDFKKLRKWIGEKENTAYLTLRRGIIEGCRVIKEELRKIDNAELEQRLLFYKTTTLQVAHNPVFYRTSVEEYLTVLEKFFPYRQPEEKHYTYLLFMKELVSKWDVSFGVFSRDKELPIFKSKLEDNFCTTCQFLIKRLRNWTVHNLLSYDISEKDVAYLFMLVMRSWIQFDLSEHFTYEKFFSGIFTNRLSVEDMNSTLSSIKPYLEESYYELKSNYEELLRFMREKPVINSKDNYFLAMVRAYSESPEKLPGNLSEKFRSKFREVSLKLAYQCFWHGLFPLWIESTYYANFESVNFNIQAIPGDSFLFFLGQLIFEESFKLPN
ncbi:MAG: hypothetical protein ACFFDT_28035 [Candidatus Hodarchaeota archaeon]